jgi:hypothetical protein
MSGDMCDQETRNLFDKQKRREWTNTIMLAVLLGIAGWMSLQTFEQGKEQAAYTEKLDNHILEYAALATKIPDGFFTKKRYGDDDARHDREINQQARKGLDDRIHALERLSASHIQEAEIWKQTIRDTVEAVRRLERISWKRNQSYEPVD